MKTWTLQQYVYATYGILLFIYWPMSHWLFSHLYHTTLGFAPGSYDPDFVKIIGTMGMIPVAGLLYAAIRPAQAGAVVFGFTVWCFLMSVTYIEVINNGHFPTQEYFNSALAFVLGLSMIPALLKHFKQGDRL